MPNPLLDIRIGTMVRANLDDPAAYIKAILPLGFESIQPFFWQTLGGKDLPRLAGQIHEAIGDADVTVSSIGVFGNPLEGGDVDRGVLQAWETVIDNAHLFGASTVSGFTGRLRGKPLPESLPRMRPVKPLTVLAPNRWALSMAASHATSVSTSLSPPSSGLPNTPSELTVTSASPIASRIWPASRARSFPPSVCQKNGWMLSKPSGRIALI